MFVNGISAAGQPASRRAIDENIPMEVEVAYDCAANGQATRLK